MASTNAWHTGRAVCPHDRCGDDAVSEVIVDSGHDLHLPAVGEERAGGDIKLPELHSDRAFPPLAVLPPALTGLRLDQPVADQDPVDRGAFHSAVAAAVHLEHQPLRPPLWMGPAQLADRSFQIGGDLPRMLMDLVAAVR